MELYQEYEKDARCCSSYIRAALMVMACEVDLAECNQEDSATSFISSYTLRDTALYQTPFGCRGWTRGVPRAYHISKDSSGVNDK